MRSVLRTHSLAVALLLLGAAGCVRMSNTMDQASPHARRTPASAQTGPGVGDSVVGVAPLPGSAPAAPASAGTMIRVGIAVDTARVEIGAAAALRADDATGREVLHGARGATFSLTRSAGGGVRMQQPGAASAEVSATPIVVRADGGADLLLMGEPYHGEILVQPGGRGLTAVNRVDMERYLLGVVPQEIGSVGAQFPEAAKAQAVAARTYAMRNMGRRSALGFDVYASTQDQVYGGAGAENAAVNEAVRATRGQVLTYGGEPIRAYYHSTCAGRTAAIDEVWNEAPVPYLVSVTDVDPATGLPYDRSSSRFHWTVTWSAPQLIGILNRTLSDSLGGRTIHTLRDLRVVERTPSGRVRRMIVSTDAGEAVVGKDRVRWILLTPAGALLNSSRFNVAVARAADGSVASVTAEGGGWGHGIGMCQVGAIGRARAGQDYRSILQVYYPGTQLTQYY